MTNTTILGVISILAAVLNAAVSFLKTGAFDVAGVFTAVTAGIGLIKAADATTAAPKA